MICALDGLGGIPLSARPSMPPGADLGPAGSRRRAIHRRAMLSPCRAAMDYPSWIPWATKAFSIDSQTVRFRPHFWTGSARETGRMPFDIEASLLKPPDTSLSRRILSLFPSVCPSTCLCSSLSISRSITVHRSAATQAPFNLFTYDASSPCVSRGSCQASRTKGG